jgi:hypothetical protein
VAHFDITTQNRDEVVGRIVTMVATAPPDVAEAGLVWYEEAHDTARNLAAEFNVSLRQAAGVLAAASPGMPADQNFGSIAALIDGTLARLTGRQRHKAQACLVDDPAEVLNPRTGPKTWAFFHNIADPSDGEFVTVDGRHADVIVNSMRPWQAARGLDTGGPNSRYASYAAVTIDAARKLRRRKRFRGITPAQVQAVAWCHAKAIEQSGTTTRGLPRKQGPQRRGQEYLA